MRSRLLFLATMYGSFFWLVLQARGADSSDMSLKNQSKIRATDVALILLF